uniref:MORN repeat-containing protein n=1 Tax=Toxoplasma gondii COUG TaxID=1074873 RepID=A0A2G8XQW8_TOXGO|nr:MORN repeat-containing protein [Toxoplasma gondii COUG]
MMFPDGSSFEGEWRDGQRHGAGVFSALIADSISSADADVPSLLSRELAAASSPRSGETGVDTPQRPGAEKRVLVVEGEWRRDSPAAEKEWTLTFPSGDKYAGLLHLPSRQNGDAVGCETETMAPSENGENASQRSKQVPTGEERHTRRRDHSQSTPYEKGEEEKGEEEKEKKERKREMNLETELRRFVLPHGPGFAKLKATGETYEGQWKLGTRNGEGESIASTVPASPLSVFLEFDALNTKAPPLRRNEEREERRQRRSEGEQQSRKEERRNVEGRRKKKGEKEILRVKCVAVKGILEKKSRFSNISFNKGTPEKSTSTQCGSRFPPAGRSKKGDSRRFFLKKPLILVETNALETVCASTQSCLLPHT